MRYTTTIDITEIPDVWRNSNISRLYTYMTLKCGYHDDDRDRLSASLSSLASGTGLTVDAVRHALKKLQQVGLIRKECNSWFVLKWIAAEVPTPRKQRKKADIQDRDIGLSYQHEIEDYQRRVLEAVRCSSRDELVTWLNELMEHRSLCHHGIYIKPNQANIDWLKKVIEMT